MYFGLDVHKEFIQVCELTARGKRRRDYRVDATEEGVRAFASRLRKRDQVALEATFHTWVLHDILSQHAGRVVVVNPLQVKAIAHARIKTDKVDAHTLAELLRADYLPEVEMPDEEAWATRQLVSHRRLLVRQRVAVKNTIRSALNRRLIPSPEGEPFSKRNRRWMRELPLPPSEQFIVNNALDLLEQLDERIDAVNQELVRVASDNESVKLLMTIPGVGVTVAVGLAGAIGDIRRFNDPNQLAAYFGLVPRVYQSAGRCFHGPITKTGNGTARSLAIEAAQCLARSPTPLVATYLRIKRKKGHNVAVTAVARKLIVIAWHMLTNREPYRYAQAKQTRTKLRSLAPRPRWTAPGRVPTSLSGVYAEAGLPELSEATTGERRTAGANRRTATRLSRRTG